MQGIRNLATAAFASAVLAASGSAYACDERILGSCKPAPVVESGETTQQPAQATQGAATRARPRRVRSSRRSYRRSRSARARGDIRGNRARRSSERKAAATARRAAREAKTANRELEEFESRNSEEATAPRNAHQTRSGTTPTVRIYSTVPVPIQMDVPVTAAPAASIPQQLAPTTVPNAAPPSRPSAAASPPAPTTPQVEMTGQAPVADRETSAAALQRPSTVSVAPPADPPAAAAEQDVNPTAMRALFLALAGALLVGTAIRLVI